MRKDAIREAAPDVIAVLMHPAEPKYNKVLEAIQDSTESIVRRRK